MHWSWQNLNERKGVKGSGWLAPYLRALFDATFAALVFWVAWRLASWSTERAVLAALWLAVWITSLARTR